jgi:hypothetical protein
LQLVNVILIKLCLKTDVINAYNFYKLCLDLSSLRDLLLCPYVVAQELSHVIEYLPTVVWVTTGCSEDQHHAILFVWSLTTLTSACLVRVEQGIHTFDEIRIYQSRAFMLTVLAMLAQLTL